MILAVLSTLAPATLVPSWSNRQREEMTCHTSRRLAGDQEQLRTGPPKVISAFP